MTRDEVLQQFGRKSCIDLSGKRVEWIDKPWSRITEAMADRIVELTDTIAAVEAELDALREQLTYQTIKLTAEHQRARDILAALREPSEAVLKAAFVAVVDFNGDLRDGITAAVAAAEREASA